ncbi:MAG: cation diffusion facilitator family transporter [Acetobacteraceae bacterium]
MTPAVPSADAAAERKERVARLSIVASAAITVGKLVAGLLSGSLALVSEAAHALVDTAATTLTWFAVRTAHKPADDEHHYGHGKFESLAALAETAVLFVLATVVTIQAWGRLQSGGGDVEPTILAFVVLIVSIVIDINRVRVLRLTARETGSQALEADALHFASDLAGSVLVLLGLLAALAGFRYGDALAAIGVAGFIAIAGWRLGRRTIDTLLDRAPAGMAEDIRRITADRPGVVAIEQLRLRPGGTHTFGEMTVAVSRTLPLERVTAVCDDIRSAVGQAFPSLSLAVTATPRILDDESVLERVLLTAARQRIPVHHIVVQTVRERLSVSLDIEVDARLSLGAAHGLATRLETALRDELGPDIEVDTHIEPLQVPHLSGEDLAGTEAADIDTALRQATAGQAIITGIHDVRVRRTPSGLVVNYHCQADAGLPVATVHAHVDGIERAVRARFPTIIRMVGHAEPMRAAATRT